MKFKFKVTQTDIFIKTIEIEADDIHKARTQLEEDLDACPIDTMSNTLESSEVQIVRLVKKKSK